MKVSKSTFTSYYKNLFWPPIENMVSMDETQIWDISQVFELENDSLIENFIEKEVKENFSNGT
jgi:hypothetical protein